ncbi:MAG: hypothetical protein JWN14_1895 [Chthonomonadales bacterium]|nr:hypothetical protein [Chthonomonadales bacterium]
MHWWIRQQLVAYAMGELKPGQVPRMEAHLQTCAACRQEVAAIRAGIALAQDLPLLKAPDDLWERLEPKLEAHLVSGQKIGRPRVGIGTQRRRLAFGVALTAICLVGFWIRRRHAPVPAAGPTWEVARLKGAPKVEEKTIGATGRLGVGQWLSTDGTSQARVKVANIGEVVLETNSRLRLRKTDIREHRLELQHGTLHAHILAPPRLFLVDTPETRAIDLGCAYTLTVEANGDSRLHVTTGKVALVRKDGGEEVVPAGAECATRQGIGLGTPVFEDAPQLLRDALMRYDFENGGATALQTVLDQARSRDTLTLWYLFVHVPESDRGRVYDRLTAFVSPPPGVSRAEMLRLEPKTTKSWCEDMEQDWLGSGG